MAIPIFPGSTDQSIEVLVVDDTSGAREPGVDHTTAGADIWYRRTGGNKVTISLASLAATNSAHADGGIKHIDDGIYRLDLPDAAVATGAARCTVGGSFTGMVVMPVTIDLGLIGVDEVATEVVEYVTTGSEPAGSLGERWHDNLDAPISGAAQQSTSLAIKAKTDSLTFTTAGLVDADSKRVGGSQAAADAAAESGEAVVRFTVGSGSSTTNIVVGTATPATSEANQLAGRTLIFTSDTATTQLRGQARAISASTAGGTLTTTAFTRAPANGDTAVIV